jgi:hypothetical protein
MTRSAYLGISQISTCLLPVYVSRTCSFRHRLGVAANVMGLKRLDRGPGALGMMVSIFGSLEALWIYTHIVFSGSCDVLLQVSILPLGSSHPR